MASQGVYLSSVIHRLIETSYTSLLSLTERLPDRSDAERKQELLRYLDKTRQQFIRALVLCKWAGSVRNISKAQEASALLAQQDQLIVSCADQLYYLAMQRLPAARMQAFDVQTAIDVLAGGGSVGEDDAATTTTYLHQRLPSAILDAAPKKPISEAESTEVIEQIERAIRLRLWTVRTPPDFTSMRIERGQLIVAVAGEFEASLTLDGDSGTNADKWILVWLDVVVAGCEASTRGTTAKPLTYTQLMQDGWVFTLKESLQKNMKESPAPLYFLYQAAHRVCGSLKFECARQEMATLRKFYRPNTVKYIEGGDRLFYWCQKKLSTTQINTTVNNNAASNTTAAAATVDTLQVLMDSPSLSVAVDSYGSIQLRHHPPLMDPETGREATFHLGGAEGCIKRELERAMKLNMLAKLEALKRILVSKLPVVYKHSGICPAIKTLATGEPYLDCPMFGDVVAQWGVDRGTGDYFIETSCQLPPYACDKIKKDAKSVVAEVTEFILKRSGVELLSRVADEVQAHSTRTENGVVLRLSPLPINPPTSSSQQQPQQVPSVQVVIDDQYTGVVSIVIPPQMRVLLPPSSSNKDYNWFFKLSFNAAEQQAMNDNIMIALSTTRRVNLHLQLMRGLSGVGGGNAAEIKEDKDNNNIIVKVAELGELTITHDYHLIVAIPHTTTTTTIEASQQAAGYGNVSPSTATTLMMTYFKVNAMDQLNADKLNMQTITALDTELKKYKIGENEPRFPVLSKSLFSLTLSTASSSSAQQQQHVATVSIHKDCVTVNLNRPNSAMATALESYLSLRLLHKSSTLATTTTTESVFRDFLHFLMVAEESFNIVADYVDPTKQPNKKRVVPGDFQVIFHQPNVFSLVYRGTYHIEFNCTNLGIFISDSAFNAFKTRKQQQQQTQQQQQQHAHQPQQFTPLRMPISAIFTANIVQTDTSYVKVTRDELPKLLSTLHKEMAKEYLELHIPDWLVSSDPSHTPQQQQQVTVAPMQDGVIKFVVEGSGERLFRPQDGMFMSAAGNEGRVLSERCHNIYMRKVLVEPWRIQPAWCFAKLMTLPTAPLNEIVGLFYTEFLIQSKSAQSPGGCEIILDPFLVPPHVHRLLVQQQQQPSTTSSRDGWSVFRHDSASHNVYLVVAAWNTKTLHKHFIPLVYMYQQPAGNHHQQQQAIALWGHYAETSITKQLFNVGCQGLPESTPLVGFMNTLVGNAGALLSQPQDTPQYSNVDDFAAPGHQ